MDKQALHFREANHEDIAQVVALLADDMLGAQREQPSVSVPAAYLDAYAAIAADPNNELIVAEAEGDMVGVLQMTYIPGMTYQGGWRAQIEGVRVAAPYRGRGYGRLLFEWALARAQARRCIMVQLASNKQRADAIRFYQSLGFVASHEGMKFFFEKGDG